MKKTALPDDYNIGTSVESDLQHLLDECKKNLSACNEEMVAKAFRFCVDAHKNDLRASGEPYYTHPLEVALIVVKEIPLDDVSVAAALLHDVVEDTTYSLDDVRAEFGSMVAEIVDGATKISGIFKSAEVKQAENYRKLLLSLVKDVRVILIKFADRLHNMRTLTYLSPERQKRMAQETLEIYAPFAHRFGMANIKWEMEDLAFKYLFPVEYENLVSSLRASRLERTEYLNAFLEPVKKRLDAEGLKYEISSRPKHLFSIYNKMRRQNKTLDELYDLLAVRIILETSENKDCFTVYGIVADIYEPIPERFKNFISRPKKNSYQSLHTSVIGPDGKRVEVQIRTKSMHEVSEKGIAAHFAYKENQGSGKVASWWNDKELEEWANWVRDIFENAGEEAPEQLLESFKLNLYQDEIYVYSPKNDLIILPQGATPIDYAFEIHSEIGYRCIGAKANGKIVPLDYKIKTGDQMEILTSKNQRPSKDWERFCITHKAKSHIRKFLNEERRTKQLEGKELWERKAKKLDLHINNDTFERIIHTFKYDHLFDFYYALAVGTANLDDIALEIQRRSAPAATTQQESQLQTPATSQTVAFKDAAREHVNGVQIGGTDSKNVLYHYARCCNPVPGDEIVGIVTIGSGIKVHRSNCKNVSELKDKVGPRIMEMNWSKIQQGEFISAIRITGDDRAGMLNDITNAIVNYNNTNIRSVNIDAFGAEFEGIVTLYVKNLDHLDTVFTRLQKIRGVKNVARFDG
ncbi:MAG: bifunctional (p)ppGpp synthetase/guanosine-3',5'-bis(diphosphate) 3'-pyrophosphohydrolase [Candidatus Kapabacteria bacterium]|nr:bifunctional (p)ppGpp synthetase/guanosine-3',5'-bis(diphosphate) 3'-pyrophosphohydrolase [Candidatus Kapabacteria bacterium]